MDILAALIERAGVFTGHGINHENEAFGGRMELAPVMGGRAITLHYTATGTDGRHLHEEFTLLAHAEDQRLCLWPVMEELPVVMPHRSTGHQGREDGAMHEVFATGPRDATACFREEISIECTGHGGIVYSHGWGMPGEAFAARSRCELLPARP